MHSLIDVITMNRYLRQGQAAEQGEGVSVSGPCQEEGPAVEVSEAAGRRRRRGGAASGGGGRRDGFGGDAAAAGKRMFVMGFT